MTDRPKDRDEGRPIETRAEDGWRLAMTAFAPAVDAGDGASILVLPAYGTPALWDRLDGWIRVRLGQP